MGAIGETGDEWIVEPEPIIVPTDEPAKEPQKEPATAERARA